jgi:cell division protein FtsB
MPGLVQRLGGFVRLLWREQQPFLVGGVFLIGLVLALIGDDRRSLKQLRADAERITIENAQLRQRLGGMNSEIVRIGNDSAALEREARERLLMGRPGEYLIPVPEAAARR